MKCFQLQNNKNLSRLSVGTVEIGQNYGVDTLGKPSYKESLSILSHAVDMGINVYDTSPGYGDSEEIIGCFLKEERGRNVYISTKLEKLPEPIWRNEVLNKLHTIAVRFNRDPKEIFVKYILGLKYIDSVLIGINSLKQLEENIRAFNSKSLEPEIRKAIDDLPILPDNILNPGKWKQ